MGKARFLSNNLITAVSMLTPSTTVDGTVSRAQKEASGSAVATVEGPFTGVVATDYLAQIDAAGTGEVGSSTFRWSDDNGVTIQASGVATSASPITLNNGVTISWASGTGADFVLGDLWRWKGLVSFGKSKLIDLDRDSEWHSGADLSGNITLTLDLGSPQTPTVLVLLDHNLTAAAQIRLQASSDNFATLALNDVVAYRADHILHYIGAPARTYRYWRIVLWDPTNTGGFLRVAELYLGTYVELGTSFDLGEVREQVALPQREQMVSGRWFGGLNELVTRFDLQWTALTKTDRDLLIGVFTGLHDVSNRQVLPVLFNPDSEILADLFLCSWENTGAARTMPQAPEWYQIPVRLVEIPRTL